MERSPLEMSLRQLLLVLLCVGGAVRAVPQHQVPSVSQGWCALLSAPFWSNYLMSLSVSPSPCVTFVLGLSS